MMSFNIARLELECFVSTNNIFLLSSNMLTCAHQDQVSVKEDLMEAIDAQV